MPWPFRLDPVSAHFLAPTRTLESCFEASRFPGCGRRPPQSGGHRRAAEKEPESTGTIGQEIQQQTRCIKEEKNCCNPKQESPGSSHRSAAFGRKFRYRQSACRHLCHPPAPRTGSRSPAAMETVRDRHHPEAESQHALPFLASPAPGSGWPLPASEQPSMAKQFAQAHAFPLA